MDSCIIIDEEHMDTQLRIATIVLNWNGEDDSLACIAALKRQNQKHTIIAVDNNSDDSFVATLKKRHPDVVLLENKENLGFSGGQNTGIRYVLEQEFSYVALINNDAVPDKDWLKELIQTADKTLAGIVTGKLMRTNGDIDSTGDTYTTWGLAYPRGRDAEDTGQYEQQEEVFGASGGASLYRVSMLRDIGMFDEDFFAYYEDVDLSFRAQLAGYKVVYEPKAIAHHKVGASSSKVSGLTTYMTIKNLPWLFVKNVPLGLVPKIAPRFFIAYWSIVTSFIAKGRFMPVIKGLSVTTIKLPKKLLERWRIQRNKRVSTHYISSIMTHDLPPNATKLRRLRNLIRRKAE